MRVGTVTPEPTMVLSLRMKSALETVLVATLGDQEQELMVFSVNRDAAPPWAGGGNLVAHTLKLAHGFPVETDAHGHMITRMRA